MTRPTPEEVERIRNETIKAVKLSEEVVGPSPWRGTAWIRSQDVLVLLAEIDALRAELVEATKLFTGEGAEERLAHLCKFGEATQVGPPVRLCEKCGAEAGSSGSVSIDIWKRDRRLLEEAREVLDGIVYQAGYTCLSAYESAEAFLGVDWDELTQQFRYPDGEPLKSRGEPISPMEKLTENLHDLRALKPGWHDGEGEAMDPDGLLWAGGVLRGLVRRRPELRPHLYPSVDGCVRMEWDLGKWSTSCHLALKERSMELHASELGGNGEHEAWIAYDEGKETDMVSPLIAFLDRLLRLRESADA